MTRAQSRTWDTEPEPGHWPEGYASHPSDKPTPMPEWFAALGTLGLEDWFPAELAESVDDAMRWVMAARAQRKLEAIRLRQLADRIERVGRQRGIVDPAAEAEDNRQAAELRDIADGFLRPCPHRCAGGHASAHEYDDQHHNPA